MDKDLIHRLSEALQEEGVKGDEGEVIDRQRHFFELQMRRNNDAKLKRLKDEKYVKDGMPNLNNILEKLGFLSLPTIHEHSRINELLRTYPTIEAIADRVKEVAKIINETSFKISDFSYEELKDILAILEVAWEVKLIE